MTQPTVRLALQPEIALLHRIERAAASRFDASDLPGSLRQQTVDAADLLAAWREGLLWVVDLHPGLAGFLVACDDASSLHILEMSVLPNHGRQGFGRRLLDAVASEAWQRGLSSVTLTTFAHVPWNGPAYARAGFQELTGSGLSSSLARRLASERAQGLGNRIAMQRDAGWRRA